MVRIDPKTLKRIKHELLYRATRHGHHLLAVASLTDCFTRHGHQLLAIASLDSSQQTQLSGKTPFSLQNPNFDSPIPKFVPKVCLNVYEHKKALKTI